MMFFYLQDIFTRFYLQRVDALDLRKEPPQGMGFYLQRVDALDLRKEPPQGVGLPQHEVLSPPQPRNPLHYHNVP